MKGSTRGKLLWQGLSVYEFLMEWWSNQMHERIEDKVQIIPMK